MRTPNPSLVVIATSAALALFAISASAQNPPPPPPAVAATAPNLAVTPDDLTAAGFTDVKIEPATASGYLPPTRYYRVKESVAGHPDWGGTVNLVAVLVFPMTYPTDFSITGEPVFTDYAGRTDACVTRPGYFICVTGPDKTKVTALVERLKSR